MGRGYPRDVHQREAHPHHTFKDGLWFVFASTPDDLALIDLSGSRGAGKAIPPNAALVFAVELVGLERDKHHEL